jgi:hypothetical protein
MRGKDHAPNLNRESKNRVSKIAGFTADETQQTYSVDGLENWQRQVTEERVADRLRRFPHLFKMEQVG